MDNILTFNKQDTGTHVFNIIKQVWDALGKRETTIKSNQHGR